MPTVKEKADVFDALVKNALDFFELSVADLKKAPKFSVVHFATGLELLLKARLFHEHWALIASDPHKASWASLAGGNVHTLQASKLCDSIVSATGERLAVQAPIFDDVFKHRNRTLHFYQVVDQGQVIAEQLAAWYHLHRLLDRQWAGIFGAHLSKLKAVETALKKNRKYLQAKYDQKKHELLGKAKGGLIITCPTCQFDAGVLSSKTATAPMARCEVCDASCTAVSFGCGSWNVISDYETEYECDCGATHDIDDLVSKLDATAGLKPKYQDSEGPGVYHCGCCLSFEARVVAVDGHFVCLGCGEHHPDSGLSYCDYCNEVWVGYNTENTWRLGCEFCDGHDPD